MAAFTSKLRRLFIGRPFANEKLDQRDYSKKTGLPILGANAFSSVAYAPDEILLTLSLAGGSALLLAPHIGVALVVLMLVLVLSYRQRLSAFPTGGDYQLVSTTLGSRSGLLVGAALLLDFVLTAAVSLAAAAHYLAAVIPALAGSELAVTLMGLLLLTWVNIRGAGRGRIGVAVLGYLFLTGMAVLLVVGMIQYFTHELPLAASATMNIEPDPAYSSGLTGLVGMLLLVRAFASGAAVATGVEVPASNADRLKKPRGKNAGTVLVLVGLIGSIMTAGTLFLATQAGIRLQLFPNGQQKPLLAQLGETVLGPGSALAAVLVGLIVIILVFAAHSAFNSFPTLASRLARDRYLPQQWANRGDRLSFTRGILWLAGVTALLVVVAQANVALLVQLYVIGVFVAFTLSQWAMVVHWNRTLRQTASPRVRGRIMTSRAINFIGFIVTAFVVVAVISTRFLHGAWIIVLTGIALALLMRTINRSYRRTSEELQVDPGEDPALPSRVHAVILISQLHRPAMRALSYARASRPSTVEALIVDTDQEQTKAVQQDWARYGVEVPLTIVASPYRHIVGPILAHVRAKRLRSPRELTVVYIPEFVVGSWFESLLHNRTAMRIKTALLLERNVMVVSVPWQLSSSDRISSRGDDATSNERQ